MGASQKAFFSADQPYYHLKRQGDKKREIYTNLQPYLGRSNTIVAFRSLGHDAVTGTADESHAQQESDFETDIRKRRVSRAPTVYGDEDIRDGGEDQVQDLQRP